MYVSNIPRFGTGTELLQKITPLGPFHKAAVVGVTANGEELVLDHPKGGTSHLLPVQDFLARTETFIGERGPSAPAERQAIIARAVNTVGTPYDLLIRNCEHISSYVRTGKATSPQLGVALLLCVLLGLLFFTSK